MLSLFCHVFFVSMLLHNKVLQLQYCWFFSLPLSWGEFPYFCCWFLYVTPWIDQKSETTILCTKKIKNFNQEKFDIINVKLFIGNNLIMTTLWGPLLLFEGGRCLQKKAQIDMQFSIKTWGWQRRRFSKKVRGRYLIFLLSWVQRW